MRTIPICSHSGGIADAAYFYFFLCLVLINITIFFFNYPILDTDIQLAPMSIKYFCVHKNTTTTHSFLDISRTPKRTIR